MENVNPETTTETAEMTTENIETIESPATYANGKYNSVGDLENGYTELQSTFSKKMGAFSGAPENYEFNEGYVSESNQGMADMLSTWGQENQMNNDGINSLVGKYNEYQAHQHDASVDAEYAKLGENAGDRIDAARGFLEANLGKEMTGVLSNSMNTAGAIEAIEKLISMSKSPSVASPESTSHASKEKAEQMRYAIDDNGNRKMEDPKYRQMVLGMEAALLGR